MTKEDLLKKLYYDQSGFSSIQNLYKEAKAQDKDITLNFVKDWHQKNVGVKRQPGGTNSFVAPMPYYEYQVDLFFINDLPKQTYKIGMCCIDIFTKYAVVVAIRSKQTDDFLAGLMECLEKMKEYPLFIFSDDEGALNSTLITDYLNKQGIKKLTTRSNASTAERFIRTFKDMVYKRIQHDQETLQKKDLQWHNYIYPVMLTYNNKNVHSSIGKTPD